MCVDNLREALKQRPDKHCAIMLDTKGPEIRTGVNKDGKSIKLVKGQSLDIVTDYSLEGDNTRIACSYKALAQSVQVGGTIFIADGSLTCEVTEILEVSLLKIIINRRFHSNLIVNLVTARSQSASQERRRNRREEEHEPPRLHR
jgi:pyruvate kinase